MREKIIEIIKSNSDSFLVTDNNKSFKYKDVLYILGFLSKYNNKKIGLYFDKSSEYIISLIGVFLSNNSFIPLNRKEPINRLSYFFNDSKIDFILTSVKNKNDKFLKDKKTIYFEDLIIDNNKSFNISLGKKEEIYRIYTSGSTGKPKGVILNNEKGLENVIEQQIDILNLNKENVFLYLSISFDASLSDIFCAFLSKSHIYINDNILLKIKNLIKYFNENKITYSDLPPSILKLINPKNLNTLKKIIIGGEKPTKKTVSKFLKENIKVLNVYGPTEATICTSMVYCDESWSPKNIGTPIKNVEYKILNNELLIGGDCLSVGYTNNELTKEKFITINKKRYFKTGDIIKLENNNYFFMGRKDRQIKHNGNLICLEEIEENIRSIKSIKNSCVIYKNKKIINIYEGNISTEELNKVLLNLIPSYMKPNYNINKKIPKTITGKNDARKLQKEIEL